VRMAFAVLLPTTHNMESRDESCMPQGPSKIGMKRGKDKLVIWGINETALLWEETMDTQVSYTLTVFKPLQIRHI